MQRSHRSGAQEPAARATGVDLGVSPDAAVLEATRALLRIDGAAGARDVAISLVHELGGRVSPSVDADTPGTPPVDLSFGEGPVIVPVAEPSSVAALLLERHLPAFVDDAQRAVAHIRLRADAGPVGAFVACSELSVPGEGHDALVAAFRHRLGAVERAPGFRRLEVWCDPADPTAFVMVSWWDSREEFSAYMRSPDHRESHGRIPSGEHEPRPRRFRRFLVVAT
jgi:heme oxygenase (mycobilin-producing)